MEEENERLRQEYEDRLTDLEETLGLALLAIDLLKNKTTTGGLSKSIATIDRMLDDIKEQRAGTGEFRNPLADLWDRLDRYFDLGELGELAFNLNVNLEKISSIEATKWDIIVDLVKYFQRRDRLDILIRAADEARPNIEQPFSEFVGVL